jgi:HAD superfamily hydrolase (TIGR01509 family)
MRKKMEAIIFDMDGLMIDSERLYWQAQKEIAGKFNKKLNDKILWNMMGRKPIESVTLFVKELDIPAEPEKILKMRNDMMLKKLKNELEPMAGLEHIINTFFNKLKLAVATGAQKEFLDLMVDRLGIREKFAVLQDSDDIVQGKPHPEIYLETCRKLDLQPGRCVVLEDSSNGGLAGKRAGCYVIAVPSEYTKEQDFSFADFIAADLFAAAKHIDSL